MLGNKSRGRGQFLNAEGAKVSQRAQKRKYKNKTKKNLGAEVTVDSKNLL
jgi:predicted RNA-binding protein YlxR (DUF448 family)